MTTVMGMKVGGISEHQDMERFAALPADVAVKDQMDLMSRCWFSLCAKRIKPIEYQFTNAGSGTTESVRITGSPEYGIATIHDQDLLIFVISQWVEAKNLGLPITRRVAFTPYQFFSWMRRKPTGSAYQRLRDYPFDTGIQRWVGRMKWTEKRSFQISQNPTQECASKLRGDIHGRGVKR